MKKFVFTLIMALLVCSTTVKAGDNTSELFKTIIAVYKQNINGMKEQNIKAVIDTLHPDAPSFKQAKEAAAISMTKFQIENTIIGAELVGRSGEYAVLRVIQKNVKISGDGKFNDNELDVIQVFKMDKDKKWKLWSSSILSAKLLESK